MLHVPFLSPPQQSNGYDHDYSTISSRVSITTNHVLEGLLYAVTHVVVFLFVFCFLLK